MKNRILGKKYNTGTAQFVASFSLDADECKHSFTEALYYKRTGEFFVFRHGGDGAEADIDNEYWVYRPEIIPLSFQDAKNWVKNNCSLLKYLSLFGDENDAEPNKCSLASRKLMLRRLNKIYSKHNKES
jgi:hypothetical protein